MTQQKAYFSTWW